VRVLNFSTVNFSWWFIFEIKELFFENRK
jgi:hypothetical protein